MNIQTDLSAVSQWSQLDNIYLNFNLIFILASPVQINQDFISAKTDSN